ncbi:MAG: hypothetical protein OMM_08319 [Candidatus Magnetoglobus multicellularis str. Araruama]|uniref:Uncharacterized protein n=1 Tax=Candidatus Magnetoglobus multicellularis str. Araruama TaxID=890399 RepID=A0A1V1P8A6_9BACT|nr:MAG: hypothetical protein OMM_08319 [Candidatus Magnetoglobus multicellularis str. Araruama]
MATINDVVLIYFEDNPVAFARIEDIVADYKPDWYHVTLLMLQLPLQTVTWILRDIYIEGDTFTMGGKRMRLEKVKAPPPQSTSDEEEATVVNNPDDKQRASSKKASKGSKSKVVSLQDRMKH